MGTQENMSSNSTDRKMLEVLCDDQSTCEIMVNPDLVVNIGDCVVTLILKTKAGKYRVTQICNIPGVGTV